MDVCDRDFREVAQRKCVSLSDGKEYCPTAFGKRTPRLEDLKGYSHESPQAVHPVADHHFVQ